MLGQTSAIKISETGRILKIMRATEKGTRRNYRSVLLPKNTTTKIRVFRHFYVPIQ